MKRSKVIHAELNDLIWIFPNGFMKPISQFTTSTAQNFSFSIFSFEHDNEPSWVVMYVLQPKRIVSILCAARVFEQTNLHVLHIPGQLLTSGAPYECNSAAWLYALQFASRKTSTDELVEI
jgi:hypothetical protein